MKMTPQIKRAADNLQAASANMLDIELLHNSGYLDEYFKSPGWKTLSNSQKASQRLMDLNPSESNGKFCPLPGA